MPKLYRSTAVEYFVVRTPACSIRIDAIISGAIHSKVPVLFWGILQVYSTGIWIWHGNN